MYFCNLLFSPNILFLGFIHNSISFSVLLVSLYKYAENYLLMVLLMNIKFFPFFTITNNAADIFLVHIPICMYAGLSLGNLVVELLGCSTCAPLAFLGWLNALQRSSSKWHSIRRARGLCGPSHSPTCCQDFHYYQLERYKIVHCGFNLHFPYYQ